MDPETTTTTTTEPPSDWFEALPPEMKVDKTVLTYKGKPVSDVVKSLVDLNRLNGSAIHLPKADATPEEQQRFYNDIYTKLGRPESPEKYEHQRPKLPDGTPWDDAGEKEFLATAHKAGLSKTQVQTVLDWYGGRLTAGMQAQGAQIEETERLLKKEWGDT